MTRSRTVPRLLLALAMVLGACGSRWPEVNVRAFTDACLENARRARPDAPESALVAYCDCAVRRLQDDYSVEEFAAIEERSRRERKPAIEIVRVVEECAGVAR